VRVAEPEKLAVYVLGDQQKWTPAVISATMRADTEQFVKLTAPLPVHLLYFTAVVNDRGDLVFFEDIYKLDQKQVSSTRRSGV
jgi:murein L,D-transpeptidase YcbB/YkuD